MCNYIILQNLMRKASLFPSFWCVHCRLNHCLRFPCNDEIITYANGMQFKLDNSITTKLQAVATYFKSITSMMVHPVWKIIRSTTIYVPLFLPLFSHRIIVAGNKSNLGVVYYERCEFPRFFSTIVLWNDTTNWSNTNDAVAASDREVLILTDTITDEVAKVTGTKWVSGRHQAIPMLLKVFLTRPPSLVVMMMSTTLHLTKWG